MKKTSKTRKSGTPTSRSSKKLTTEELLKKHGIPSTDETEKYLGQSSLQFLTQPRPNSESDARQSDRSPNTKPEPSSDNGLLTPSETASMLQEFVQDGDWMTQAFKKDRQKAKP